METETEERKVDTQHEPHEHAKKRVLLGVGAVVVLALVIGVWLAWGDTIKEKCFGEEVCEVELPEASI